MAELQARPTLYKGIQMRSRLEAGYAAWLDYQEIPWEYEPQCYASDRGQYLPDFVLPACLVLGEPCFIVVETKPTMILGRQARSRIEVMLDQDFDPPALLIETPEGSIVRLPQMDHWALAVWTWLPTGEANLTAPLTKPWQGKWWEGIEKPRPKVGSAINP